ncbi:hypothetical protein CAI21_02755 [Alkalilimnicola ehrlichii]|uniref:TetR/AcrR family transcriptional regulator n=1 Tax=Alkalilimnicola ehrlichii TaxID=351052 RepID=UPI000E2F82D0|nr:TetR/AcrR family transcriptional regulator [Alkalilimnicola ehrlichii]RFA30914.1 hypothetical protein CAI21_02755 [Alkalilimnicola ehrlichii]
MGLATQREPVPEASERIIAAAAVLFAERGFKGVSVRDIASTAGVSKANVFHHFENKWELYRSVLESSAEHLSHLLERLQPDRANVEELLASYAGDQLACMLEESDATRLFLREMIEPQPEHEPTLVSNVLDERFDLLVASLARLAQRGKLRSDLDPTTLAMLLLGGIWPIFSPTASKPATRKRNDAPPLRSMAVRSSTCSRTEYSLHAR